VLYSNNKNEIIGLFVNNKLEIILKVQAVVWFKVLSLIFPARDEESRQASV
jgi:hypothetical protein